jgi:hypothetical protein
MRSGNDMFLFRYRNNRRPATRFIQVLKRCILSECQIETQPDMEDHLDSKRQLDQLQKYFCWTHTRKRAPLKLWPINPVLTRVTRSPAQNNLLGDKLDSQISFPKTTRMRSGSIQIKNFNRMNLNDIFSSSHALQNCSGATYLNENLCRYPYHIQQSNLWARHFPVPQASPLLRYFRDRINSIIYFT